MAVSVCDVRTNGTSRDLTRYGRPDFPVACFEDDMRRITVPVHWHEEYEYIIATAGAVTLRLGTDTLVLREGEAVLLNSGCLHGVAPVTEGVSVLRSLVILPRLIGGSGDCCIWQRLIVPLARPDAPDYLPIPGSEDWQREASALMLRAWDAVTAESWDYENEARYLIARALRLAVEHCPFGTPRRDDPAAARVKQALAFIEAHYMEDIGNPTLTELCACSESVLLRSFRQIVGCAPMQYVLRYRIDRAA